MRANKGRGALGDPLAFNPRTLLNGKELTGDSSSTRQFKLVWKVLRRVGSRQGSPMTRDTRSREFFSFYSPAAFTLVY